MTSLWVVLLAAGASGIATLALLPQVTAIARERWAGAALRPIFLQSAISALFPGLVAIAFRAPPEWALGCALAGGGVALARLTIRYTPIRTVKRLTSALTNELDRPRALAEIGPALDRARPNAGNAVALGTWAQAGLIGAAYLVDADEPEAARGVLTRMSGLTFRGPSLANHALIWAHVELFANDLVRARSALGAIPKPVTMPLLEAHCDVLEALALACEGHGDVALRRLDAWRHSENWYSKLRLTARVVAHASRGEDVARERVEAELGRRFGPRALQAARKLADLHEVAEPEPPQPTAPDETSAAG